MRILLYNVSALPVGKTTDGYLACQEDMSATGGAPPPGVGGPKIYLRLKEPKNTYATSRSRRRIHPPTKSGAFCVVGKIKLTRKIIFNTLPP